MRQIDWKAVKQRRKDAEVQMAMKGRKGGSKNSGAAADEPDSDDDLDMDAQLKKLFARKAKDKKTKPGIQIRLVNGQQVIDETSQRVDFHALANQDMDTLQEVEEDDITKRFNAQTFINMKRREPAERIPNREKWGNDSTNKFYECLSRYGTDFMIISNMFAGKSRRQIRAKFVKEERENPLRIQEALLGTEKRDWDLEHFKQETGLDDRDFKDPRKVDEELRKTRVLREAAIATARAQTAEHRRQKRLLGHLSSDDEEEDEEEVEQPVRPAVIIPEIIEISDNDED
jgi:transcription factor TFIIIB component B''